MTRLTASRLHFDDLIDVGAQRVAIVDLERLVHAAGNAARAVDLLADDVFDDFLAELAGQHSHARQIGKGGGDAEHIAFRDLALEAKQQIRRGQMEEVQRVRLNHLPVVEQPAQFFCGRGERAIAGDQVHRLGRGEMVADRADAAQALHDDGHFPIGPTLDERFKAAELDDVQARLMDLVVVVEQQRHLAVAFDARNRLDRDAAQRGGVFSGFERRHASGSAQS